MRIISLFFKSYGMYIKNMVEYRPAFIMDMLIPIFIYLMAYLGIWILLDRFKMIQGWTLYEVMFLYNLNLVSYALTSFVFRVAMFQEIQNMIRMGNFDIVLTKPVNTLVYMLLGRPNPAYFGQLTLSVVVFVLCFTNLDIQLTPIKVIFFITTIIGGTLIQSASFLFVGTLSFWVVRTSAIYNTIIGTSRDFLDYPISIYSKLIQIFLTFVIPFAFINFYPSTYLLDKQGENLFHPVLQYGSIIVGIILFLLAYKFWRIGVNKYESTGS
jgi:ABC-2 type transport system permease protein